MTHLRSPGEDRETRLERRDIWHKEVRAQPTAVKKALELVGTLIAGKSTLAYCRVDAHVDYLTFI